MATLDEPLVAHSLAEAYLYLMATPCGSCGRGPLRGGEARTVDARDCDQALRIDATCSACQEVMSYTFKLAQGLAAEEPAEGAVVNPGDEPSRIIDVAQWITLFRMITETAGKETDKTQARHLGIEAAQCLEEALKFYDDLGNDLPPPEALFHDASRERFRQHPQQFSRHRLIDFRSKLPTLVAMRSRLKSPTKQRWWRRRK